LGSERGIALVITLIMLSVITFMAITLLVMARGHKTTVTIQTDQAIARFANDIAIERAQAELLAPMLASTNASSFNMLVSTNFINAFGFVPNNTFPTNVNYDYKANGSKVFTTLDWEQNIANLLFSPRPPVFVPTNRLGSNDFRYYLDLNRNGNFDATGLQFLTNNLGKQIQTGTNFATGFLTGDPQWIGVLQYQDRPHSADNPFLSRYCYAVVPLSQTLDVNYIHNQAARPDKPTIDPTGADYRRNQGVGTWEINLASFLYDLNTNIYAWGGRYFYQPTASPAYVNGNAFVDACSILTSRYGGINYPASLSSVSTLFANAGRAAFTRDGIDDYSAGPIMTSRSGLGQDPDNNPDRTTRPYPGADNTNHFYSPEDFFDPTKTSPTFVNRLQTVTAQTNTYDKNTYYRLLSQLGTDSAPEDPTKINLNFDNLVRKGPQGVASVTNFIPWEPSNFFHTAANKLLANAGYNPALVATTNIQVFPTNFYTPGIHRMLQLAANIYDATTSSNYNVASATNGFPTVFRPLFRQARLGTNTVVFVAGYREVQDANAWLNSGTAPRMVELDGNPANINLIPQSTNPNVFSQSEQNEPMVSGVPLIVGGKKGFPNFNEFAMQTGLLISRLLEFKRDVTDGPVAHTNQMYVLGITNAFGLEAWNSYSNPYPRNLRLITSAIMTATITNLLTNSFGTLIYSNGLATGVTTNIPPGRWQGWVNANAAQNSFVLPWGANTVFMFLTNSTYVNQPPGFDPQTHIFTRSALGGFYVPRWLLTLKTRVQFILVDTDVTPNRIVDFVNLEKTEPGLDIMAKLSEGANCSGNPAEYTVPAEQWCTNRLHGNLTAPTIGIMNQIGIGLNGVPGLNGGRSAAVDIQSFSQDPYSGLDAESAIDGFRYNLMALSPIFPKDQAKVFYKSNLFYAPFDPYKPIYLHTSWQANDPLVHYTIGDLIDLSVGESNRVDSLGHNPPLDNIAQINKRYQPWGGNPLAGDTRSDPFMFEMAVKDPGVGRSDSWDFPTNKFANIGWLGRVHRGTPWQTLFLKSTNVLHTVGPDRNSMLRSMGLWQKWVGNPFEIPNIGLISTNYFVNGSPYLDQNGFIMDAAFSLPTNDWHIVDLFTTVLNDNAARGRLSVNQPGLAAWSAVLSGVNVLPDARTNTFIEPAGAYDPLNPPPLARIVNGINNTRTNFPNNAYQRLGDVLATPELTVASPYLFTNSAFLNEEAVERIPQQVLGLLRGGDQPRFLIYSYGQTLKPAPHSIVTSGTYFGLCTNYQITAEVATRAVVRIDGAPTNTHAVVESYNILPPD
jgi:hypothetical protein